MISSVFTVRRLQSDDINTIISTQEIRDRVIAQPEVKEIKILWRSYLVEIPEVPLLIRLKKD